MQPAFMQHMTQKVAETSANDDDVNNSPLFHSDDFRIWYVTQVFRFFGLTSRKTLTQSSVYVRCMKVIPCTKRFVHDWTICPFAHAGEKAVRRDPRIHNYTGIACPDMKKTGNCIRSERCPYAHNVFEYWLHPTRYRTQLCNDGPLCKRGICFFAHSLDELRVPACKPYVSPEALARASLDAIHQNPHPLGQQLPGPLNDQQAVAQAAALAALNGALNPPLRSQSVSGHLGGAAPRLSTDYGELPRWSNNALMPNSTWSHDRSSFDYVGSVGLADSGRPSLESTFASTRPSMECAAALSPHGSGSVTLSTIHSGLYEGFGLDKKVLRSSLGDSIRSNNSSADLSGSATPASSAPAEIDPRTSPQSCPSSTRIPTEAELAQSLATLKIALTQQQVASAASGTNHDIVISTLHQILKKAVSNQADANDGLQTTSNDAEAARMAEALLNALK